MAPSLRLRLLAPLLLLPAVLHGAEPGSRWLPGPKAPVALPQASTETADLPPATEQPAWIQWLGWSDDGHRLAWRQGPATEPRRPGLPVEIVRLDSKNAFADRLHVTTDILTALNARRIHVTPPVESQQVAPGDVILRTAKGRLLAVAVRGEPAIAAVLMKRGKSYQTIARWPVRSPATSVVAYGWEDAEHRLLAIVATTGRDAQSQAHLVLVPLANPVSSTVPAVTP